MSKKSPGEVREGGSLTRILHDICKSYVHSHLRLPPIHDSCNSVANVVPWPVLKVPRFLDLWSNPTVRGPGHDTGSRSSCGSRDISGIETGCVAALAGSICHMWLQDNTSAVWGQSGIPLSC